MACIYSLYDGLCSNWNEDDDMETTYENCEYGWDEMGYCCCEDDPDPSYTCSSYEEC